MCTVWRDFLEAQTFHEFHEYWSLIVYFCCIKVAIEYGLGQIVLTNLTWLCPAYRQCLFTGELPFPEQSGSCLPEFLHRRPVYQVKVWQLTRQASVDFTQHTLHWLALLLYTGSLTNFVKIHELKSCRLFLKCLCLENLSL